MNCAAILLTAGVVNTFTFCVLIFSAFVVSLTMSPLSVCFSGTASVKYVINKLLKKIMVNGFRK